MFRKNQIGIYIHWPFCASKCPYCDFNSHVHESIDHDAWKKAYLRALQHYAEVAPGREVVSVFFGGGTPSLMKPDTVEAVISEIQKLWPIANDIEVTLEANPTSVEMEKFKAFRSAGVNRVSLGLQALNDKDLNFLGREHNAHEAQQAIEIGAQTFDRYSFDLIYARPKQSLSAWEDELKKALRLARGHMSLYQLTIEKGTPFYMRHGRGEFAIPDDVLGADFYHLTQDIMEEAGLPAYEVSNHAAEGQACRHNLIYWHYADYIGIGPGAHGRLSIEQGKVATRDHSAPDIWLKDVQASGTGTHPFENLSDRDQVMEKLMMGLRTCDGVLLSSLSDTTSPDYTYMIHQENLKRIIGQNWAVQEEGRLRLTREGMLRLNVILPYVLAC